ncbi:MAG: hypothetical protein ACP5OZ_01980 [Candidatus Woesearchaeota archaeon]
MASLILKINKSEHKEYNEVMSYFRSDIAERRSKDYLEKIEKELKFKDLVTDYNSYLKKRTANKDKFLFKGLPERISCLVTNQEKDILLSVTENAEKRIEEIFDYYKNEILPNLLNPHNLRDAKKVNYEYLEQKIKQIIRTLSFLNKENFNAKICVETKNEFKHLEQREQTFNLIINMRYHPISYAVENLHETIKSIYLCLKADLEESINKGKTIEAIVKENEIGEFEAEFLRIKEPIIRNSDLLIDEENKNECKKLFYRIYLFDYSKTRKDEKEKEIVTKKRKQIKDKKSNKSIEEQLF